tara:strand:+ start:405 stop:656 length:252 start_codon:yes stop_codon:yes gene_type:complete
LIGQTKLKPMAGEPTIHADAVATILSLVNIAWSPGTLQKHNLTCPMQCESQPSAAIGRQKQVGSTSLKMIDRSLSLFRFLPTG